MVRLISWNIAGRSRKLAAQMRAILELHPDIVCLQEVRAATAPLLSAALCNGGLPYSVDSFRLAANPVLLTGPRQYGEFIASRWRIRALPQESFKLPWPEKVVSAVIRWPPSPLEVHTAHIPPGSSNGWTKIQTFNGIFERLARSSTVPRVLCGDFNSPQLETLRGEVVTWGQDDIGGRYEFWRTSNGRTGRDWDAGERSVLVDLARFDLPDVFRGTHGFSRQEFSWYLKRKGTTIGRRFDHVFASRRLAVHACRYVHALRESGLSDHSPIEVDFELAS
jgi:exonuclease III